MGMKIHGAKVKIRGAKNNNIEIFVVHYNVLMENIILSHFKTGIFVNKIVK